MKRWRTAFILLLLALICFGLAGRENHVLLALRRTHHLTQADPLENAPPMVTFSTMVLGGFRGILADALWVRASRLQQEGKYFELNQLAQWITQLEPRIAEVWAYQAWNLSYNISVLFQDPADRWRWVRSGIRLLRDQGLIYNPASASLHYELGWLFQHKLGAMYDQSHLYYKKQWAAEMGRLFEGPAPDYERLNALPENPSGETLSLYERKQTMINQFKLYPEIMEEIDQQYGPLDWRLPPAHAIYWAYTGRAYARGYDTTALDRMIYQSLIAAFRSGKLYDDPARNLFFTMPDIALLPKIKKVFEQAIAQHPAQETIRETYHIFLKEAVLTCYSYHQVKRAKTLFNEMNVQFPASHDPVDFNEFIYTALTEEIDEASPQTILQLIEGALYQSEFWLRLGEDERAAGYQALATLLWQQYYDAHADPVIWERLAIPPLAEINTTVKQGVTAIFSP